MLNFISKLFRKKNDAEAAHGYRPTFIEKPCALSIEERIRLALKGIVVGDIVGSKYEGDMLIEKDPFKVDLLGEGHTYTDDTIMTIATLEATKIAKHKLDSQQTDVYAEIYRDFGRWYPDAGYGCHFQEWLKDETMGPYGSCGNGAAMRAGIIGAMFEGVGDVIYFAKQSALPSHNHPEGIHGAIVTAVITWMCFHGATKEDIRNYLAEMYSEQEYEGYPVTGESSWTHLIATGMSGRTLSLICQTSVPEAFINLLHSTDYESYVRNVMRYLCDRDTLGAIAGGAAAALYGNIVVEGKTGDEIITEYVPRELHKHFGLDPDYP